LVYVKNIEDIEKAIKYADGRHIDNREIKYFYYNFIKL